IGGEKAWMLAEYIREVRELPPSQPVRLLPGFDPYVIGASRHAEHLLTGGSRLQVYRPQGWVSAVLLVNGRMLGTWRHEVRGCRIEVRIEPFTAVPGWVRRAAGQEAERLAEFLGGKLNLSWKT